MAFSIASELRETPAVRILFHGLLIWTPDSANDKHCHIGVHRGATDHYLTVEVRIKRPNAPDFIIMRHAGPLSFLDGDDKFGPGMRMGVEPETNDGVQKFIAPAAFERKCGSMSHANDYRWAVNLENFHDAPVKLDDHVMRPGIVVTDGILHTAMKTHDDVKIEKFKNGRYVQDFFPIAAIAGINVYLTPEQTFSISFRKDGLLKELPLKTAKASDLSYEIYIDNNPTYTEVDHNEFKEYYKALPEVPTSEQFELRFKPPATDKELKFIDKGDGLGTPRIACMPVCSGG